jgi:hyperosmotically inducible protein
MSEYDEELKGDIIKILKWDDRVDSSEIDVSVKNRRVTIKGTIPSYYARAIVGADVWRIRGVKSLSNQLNVKYPTATNTPKESDATIRNNIKISLEMNVNIDASNIEVSVQNGIVTLEGFVDSYWKKEIAESIASEHHGVIDIINKIAIVPTKEYVDKEIADDIITIIDKFYNLDIGDIDVKVNQGKVTLMGEVSDWEAYNTAIDAVRYTAGTIEIDDNLVITEL